MYKIVDFSYLMKSDEMTRRILFGLLYVFQSLLNKITSCVIHSIYVALCALQHWRIDKSCSYLILAHIKYATVWFLRHICQTMCTYVTALVKERRCSAGIVAGNQLWRSWSAVLLFLFRFIIYMLIDHYRIVRKNITITPTKSIQINNIILCGFIC